MGGGGKRVVAPGETDQRTVIAKLAVIEGPEELREGSWEVQGRRQRCQPGGPCSKQRLGGARRTW